MPLTDTKLRAVRPTGARLDLPDSRGLILRIGAGGSMTWTVTYRVAGMGASGKGPVAQVMEPFPVGWGKQDGFIDL